MESDATIKIRSSKRKLSFFKCHLFTMLYTKELKMTSLQIIFEAFLFYTYEMSKYRKRPIFLNLNLTAGFTLIY